MRFRLVLILMIIAIPCRSLLCQTRTRLQVGHDSWTFKEGAPANVEALAQTSDGFLWLGTGGGLFRFSADFRLDDGVMDLWAFEGVTYGQALRLAWAVQRQKHIGHPGVHRLTGDHFELEATGPAAVQTDGEPRPPAPRLVVEVVPRALRLLVPPTAPRELYLSNGSGA